MKNLKEKIEKILSDWSFYGFKDHNDVADQILNLFQSEIKSCLPERMDWVGGEAEKHIQIADGYNQYNTELIQKLKEKELL